MKSTQTATWRRIEEPENIQVGSILDRIKASMPSLSPSEKRVGQLVLDDTRSFVSLSIGGLAERAYVSKPTVVRFSRSVGYKGLSDLKRKLSGLVVEGLPYIHGGVDGGDSATEIFVKIIDSTSAAIQQYRSCANRSLIFDAVKVLAETYSRRRSIEIYGVGASGEVARDLQNKLLRLGVRANALSDSRLQIVGASTLTCDDCVVVISNSGRTRDVLESCAIARNNGATVVTITATGSPLAEMAHIHLAANHFESYEWQIPAISRLLHMMIVDVIVAGISVRLGGDSLTPMIREMGDNLCKRK